MLDLAKRDSNPALAIARMAIEDISSQNQGDLLAEVIRYAFDQLCWRRTHGDLADLLTDLGAVLEEAT